MISARRKVLVNGVDERFKEIVKEKQEEYIRNGKNYRMTKAEAIAYLRKKRLQEKLEAEFVPTVTEETEEELRKLDGEAREDLTTSETRI